MTNTTIQEAKSSARNIAELLSFIADALRPLRRPPDTPVTIHIFDRQLGDEAHGTRIVIDSHGLDELKDILRIASTEPGASRIVFVFTAPSVDAHDQERRFLQGPVHGSAFRHSDTVVLDGHVLERCRQHASELGA